MLPVSLLQIMKTQCWNVNPMSMADPGLALNNFDNYQQFLSACGHDTEELVAAIARTRAAIQDLKCVNEWMHKRFNENPFPFITAAVDEAKSTGGAQETEGCPFITAAVDEAKSTGGAQDPEGCRQ
jgi:hypothetical protein